MVHRHHRTPHQRREGVCAAVIDVWSRRIVGWSIADHIRTELVVDALQMAQWQRRPAGTIVHSDRGSQFTSWTFGPGVVAVLAPHPTGETRPRSTRPSTELAGHNLTTCDS